MKQIRINAILTIAVMTLTAFLILATLPLASAQNAGLVGQVGRAEPPTFAGTGTPPAVAGGIAMWGPMSMTTDTATPTFTATWTPTTVATSTATPTTTPTPTATLGPCGPTEVTGGTINIDTTWHQACSPYILKGNVVVGNGVALTIEPGVQVKFDADKGLQVNGTLVARGTAGAPITFTTSLTTPVAGAWQFISFMDSSVDATFDDGGNYTGGSILQHCQVLYGGGSGATGAIQITSAAPFIDHCEVADSAQAGIRVENTPGLKISNSTVRNNRWGGIRVSGSGEITIEDSTIRDNDFTHVHGVDSPNGAGISVSGNFVTAIRNNIIDDNSNGGYCKDGGGISVSGGTVTITDNTITNNATVNRGGGINISSSTTGTISDNTIQGNTSASSCTQYGTGGAGINISDGTITISNNVIRGNQANNCGDGGNGGGGVYVGGGTVTITGNTISDNLFNCGNPSNHNGGAGVWIGNMWGGPGPTVILTNNTITGNQIQNRGSGAGMYIDCSKFTVTDNTISNNSLNNSSYAAASGIRFNNSYSCVQSGSTFARNVITGNSGANAQSRVIRIPVNYYAINNNSIHDNNTPYTLWYDGAPDTTLDATNNWWGTTDASVIIGRVYDHEDNLLKGEVNVSPILGTDSTTPPPGPANPSVSITGYTGTTADPIVSLALSATSATQMLISDDHTFPAQFQWEPFAATKDFHTDGTKYIYTESASFRRRTPGHK